MSGSIESGGVASGLDEGNGVAAAPTPAVAAVTPTPAPATGETPSLHAANPHPRDRVNRIVHPCGARDPRRSRRHGSPAPAGPPAIDQRYGAGGGGGCVGSGPTHEPGRYVWSSGRVCFSSVAVVNKRWVVLASGVGREPPGGPPLTSGAVPLAAGLGWRRVHGVWADSRVVSSVGRMTYKSCCLFLRCVKGWVTPANRVGQKPPGRSPFTSGTVPLAAGPGWRQARGAWADPRARTLSFLGSGFSTNCSPLENTSS